MKVMLAVCGTHRYFGMPKQFYYLAKYLMKHGIDVEVIVDTENGVKQLSEVCNAKATVLAPQVKGAMSTLAFCQSIDEYLSQKSFELFHTCHVLPYRYLKHEHKPVVFHPFGNELFTLGGKGMNRIYCRMAQPILKFCGHNCEALLAEGDWQLKDMAKWYTNPRMYVVPVAIDTSVIPRTVPHNGSLHLLAVNSLIKYDGVDVLIEAFRRVSKAREATLVVVGSGPMEEKLRAQAKDLRVIFHKNIPESSLYKLYEWADLFVSTSRQTDIQMGILEAEAAGLPIVATSGKNTPSCLPELINGNGAITWLEPDILSKVILRVAEHDKTTLGNRSREIVHNFDWEVVGKSVIDVYEAVLA